MKVLRFAQKGLKEVWRFAKWLWRHFDEIVPIIEIVRKLVQNAEIEGGTGPEKKKRVAERIGLITSPLEPAGHTVNLAIEHALGGLEEDSK